MQNLELAILDFIQLHFRCGFLDAVVPAFSRLCNHGELWILLALILLAIPKTRRCGAAVAAALVLDLLFCNGVLKPLVRRVRPCDVNQAVSLLIPRPTDFSFPSGHTAASFAAAAALWKARSRLRVPALITAVLMGLSRLYLYVHWPSDVVGGALVGSGCGLAGEALVSWMISRRKKADEIS